MPMYQVDFNYKLPEWGSIDIEATDPEQAEEFAMEEIKEIYEDIEDVVIDGVRETTNG